MRSGKKAGAPARPSPRAAENLVAELAGHGPAYLAVLGQEKSTDNRISAVRAFAPAGSQVGFALQPLAAS